MDMIMAAPELLSQGPDFCLWGRAGSLAIQHPLVARFGTKDFLPFKNRDLPTLLFLSSLPPFSFLFLLPLLSSLSPFPSSLPFFLSFFLSFFFKHSIFQNPFLDKEGITASTAGLWVGEKLLGINLAPSKVNYYNDLKREAVPINVFKITWVKLLKWKDLVST